MLRIPLSQQLVKLKTIYSSQTEHHYELGLSYLEHLIAQPRHQPFFAYVHVKYLHYPYIDKVHPEARWDLYLSEAEIGKVKSNLANKLPSKDIFKILLTLTRLIVSNDQTEKKFEKLRGKNFDSAA